MSEQNINGPFSGLEKTKQFDEKTFQQFNGVHSSQSSRSSSPSIRFGQIPSNQLPPNRPIPQSQLPPPHSTLTPVNQIMGSLTLSQGTINTKFSTSLQNPANVRLPTASPMVGQQMNINSVPSLVPNFAPSLQATSRILNSSQDGKSQVNDVNSQKIPNQVNGNNGPIDQNRVNFLSASSSELSQQNVLKQNIAYTQPSNQTLPQVPVNLIQSTPTQRNVQDLANHQFKFQRPQLQTSQSNLSQKLTGPPLSTQSSSIQDVNNFNTHTVQQPSFLGSNTVISQNVVRIPTSPQASAHLPVVNNSIGAPPIRGGPPPLGMLPPQKSSLLSNRYPSGTTGATQFSQQQQYFSASPQQQQQQLQQPYNVQQHLPQNANTIYQQNNYNNQQSFQSVTQSGFNKLWGTESYDLLQTPNILPPAKIEPPKVYLGNELLDQANCSSDIFRCTMTKIPENNSLLQKSRLPLGVLIHPFRDLSHLPVIQCNVIVRCRACRTYINPYVIFIDNKRWKCNLCYRINELPEEFQYDPVTKTYGDPSRRPEIKSSTLEYIAPAEYMLRPPQPAVYLFLIDVSRLAVESGYLQIVSNILLEEIKNLPGDARTLIGFIAYDSAVHFYSLSEGITQPQEMTVLEIDEIFLPTPDNLLVNLRDRMELIVDLLLQLPNRFANTFNTNSALGAALQAAYKMMSALGGRVTVFQASLPNVGPGALTAREDPAQRTSVEVTHLNPVNDFYKRLALECSGQQIAVDLFVVNSQYVDIATISGISRFSGGCIHHFPLLRPSKPLLCESFARSFRRYLTRKIGFEAVMRIRCTRGLSIHTFHGNFFVRSTDLLSLPNINPDAGFGMQVAIEESLSDVQSVCFQAALLYTSSKGERRIRVHTICLPVVSTLHDVIHSADQQCIVGLLSKMAVDRSMQSSLSDAREAFINVAIDILSSYKMSINLGSPVSGLLAPNCLRLLPLYISALLKYHAFRIGGLTRLDDRVMAMINMKTKPLYLLMQQVYPDLYPIHELENQQVILNLEEEPVPLPPKLQLTARCLENKGAFLMDMGEHMIILICPNVPLEFLNEALGVSSYSAMPEELYEIPILDNLRNQRLHQFINYLNEDKPFVATIQVIRDNSSSRLLFFERLIEDRVENALSYHEFLQHLKTQVK